MAPISTAITTSAPTVALAQGQRRILALQAQPKILRAFLKPSKARQALAFSPRAAATDVVQVQSCLANYSGLLSDVVSCIILQQYSGAMHGKELSTMEQCT